MWSNHQAPDDPLLLYLVMLLEDLTSSTLEMETAYLDWLGVPYCEHGLRWKLLLSSLARETDGRFKYPWLYPTTFTERRVSRLLLNYFEHRHDDVPDKAANKETDYE